MNLQKPVFNKKPESQPEPEQVVAEVAPETSTIPPEPAEDEELDEDIAKMLKKAAPQNHQSVSIFEASKNMLTLFLGKRDKSLRLDAVADIKEHLRQKFSDHGEVALTQLGADVRSSIVLLGLGNSAVCPANHCLVRYNNTNVLVNNSFYDMKQITKIIDLLTQSEDKEIEVYSKDPVLRLLNDTELQALLTASDGGITEIKNYNQAGELIYHAIRTI